MVDGPITQIIRRKIQDAFHPVAFDIRNDSHLHAGHAEQQNRANKVESHFRLRIISDVFAGQSMPARHRQVYHLFRPELSMPNGIHALALETRTPEEAEARG